MRTAVAIVAAILAATLGAAGVARAAATDAQSISGARFEHLAKQALARVPLTGDEALVQATSVRDQELGLGTVTLRVESPLVTPSFVNVPIDILLDGAFVRTYFVGYRVQQYVRTAVAAHDIVAGSVLAASDLRMARVPSFGRLPNGMHALVGRKLVATMRKGQPIYPEETMTNMIVKAGSTVVLIVNDGGVSVVAEVLARSSGGLGDEVALYNPATHRALSGQVVGPDRVELDILGVQR